MDSTFLVLYWLSAQNSGTSCPEGFQASLGFILKLEHAQVQPQWAHSPAQGAVCCKSVYEELGCVVWYSHPWWRRSLLIWDRVGREEKEVACGQERWQKILNLNLASGHYREKFVNNRMEHIPDNWVVDLEPWTWECRDASLLCLLPCLHV